MHPYTLFVTVSYKTGSAGQATTAVVSACIVPTVFAGPVFDQGTFDSGSKSIFEPMVGPGAGDTMRCRSRGAKARPLSP